MATLNKQIPSYSSNIFCFIPIFIGSPQGLASFGLALQVLTELQHMSTTGTGIVIKIFCVSEKLGNKKKSQKKKKKIYIYLYILKAK